MQFPSGHSTVFAIVDNAAALAWVANLGCIELHTWHSRVPEIERPDYLLIDLDPTSDGQWPFVREIALVVREVMDELGLRSYPKTSGATGLHILAPIRPEVRVPGRAPAREGDRGGGRAARRRPGGRDDDVAGRRPRRRVRRLRPERTRPHDRLGVLGAPDARRARLGAAPAGTRSRPSSRRRSRSRRCRRGSPRSATRCGACGATRRRCARASRSSASSRLRLSGLGERRSSARRRRVRVARRPHLAPRAVARVLVLAPADELRAVAEAVALHLVVAHLDDELRPQPRLLELAASPTGSAPRSAGRAPRRAAAARAPRRRRASSPRRRTSRRSRTRRPRGRGRAAASRSPSGRLFQRTPMTAQSAVRCSLILTTASREPGRYGDGETLPDHAVEAERLELRHPGRAPRRCRASPARS